MSKQTITDDHGQTDTDARARSNIRIALILGAVALLVALTPLLTMRNMAS